MVRPSEDVDHSMCVWPVASSGGGVVSFSFVGEIDSGARAVDRVARARVCRDCSGRPVMGNLCGPFRLARTARSIDEPLRPGTYSAGTPGARSTSPSVQLPESEEEKAFKAGITKFNIKASEGIRFLLDQALLEPGPVAVATFLHSKRLFRGRSELQSGLSKRQIGLYLGTLGRSSEDVQFHQDLLVEYVRHFAFAKLALDTALRTFLDTFRLPGEAQSIDRIMEQFAAHFLEQNPGHFSSPDTIHVLAFALIMLNTDAHNPNVKKQSKMTQAEFVKMNRGIDGGNDIKQDVLEGLYQSIVQTAIHTDWETGIVTFFNPTCEGYLQKRAGSGAHAWQRRYFLLNEHCLYYFNAEPGAMLGEKENCRCIIPLENCMVVPGVDGPLTFALKPSNPFESKMKSAKRMKNGDLQQGQKKEYVFRADSITTQVRWVKALTSELSENPLLDALAQRRAFARRAARASNHGQDNRI